MCRMGLDPCQNGPVPIMMCFTVPVGGLEKFVQAWLDHAVNQMSDRGISVVGIWTAADSDLFALISDPSPQVMAEVLTNLVPALPAMDSVWWEEIDHHHFVRPLELPLSEADPSLLWPEPARVRKLTPSTDGLSLLVSFTRSAIQNLHHVEVVEGKHTVRLTIYLGERAGLPEGMFGYALVAYHRWTKVQLEQSLGDRKVVDGSRLKYVRATNSTDDDSSPRECPKCGWPDLEDLGWTEDLKSDQRTRNMRCIDCGHRWGISESLSAFRLQQLRYRARRRKQGP